MLLSTSNADPSRGWKYGTDVRFSILIQKMAGNFYLAVVYFEFALPESWLEQET